MGMFRDALRQLEESELRCPNCGRHNKPGPTKIVTLAADRRAHCEACQHDWIEKER